jgi:hypothetical protein
VIFNGPSPSDRLDDYKDQRIGGVYGVTWPSEGEQI